QATLASGGAIGGAVNAPAGSTNLTVSVQDSTGATVDTFNVSPADTGMTSFIWKGATSSGGTAPAGTYTLGVRAAVDGKSQKIGPMAVNKVDSVLIDPSTNAVDVQTDTGTV